MCGGSSGAIVSAAIKLAKEKNLPSTARIVAICPDGIRNYLSKFISKEWLVSKHILSLEELKLMADQNEAHIT